MFGAEVVTFRRLVRALAEAAGVGGRPARARRPRAASSPPRCARRRCACSPPRARAPGFADAAGALFEELQRALVTPARFTRALRSWEGAPRARRRAGGAVLRLPPAAGADGRAATSRASPARRSTRCASARRRGAPGPCCCTGSTTWTPPAARRGGDAVRARRGRGVRLAALRGGPRRVRGPRGHRRAAEAARRAPRRAPGPLRALRPRARAAPCTTWSGGCSSRARARWAPNGAVRLLESGGERAEAELVAAEVLELMREGVAPEDIAVLVRSAGRPAAVLADGLADYGVPVALDGRVALSRTRLGAGVLAFARAGLPGGTAQDVLTWLRTPGKLADPDAADALEARVRRTEATTAEEALRLWEGEPPELLAEVEPAELLAGVLAEAEAIWTAPHVRRGEVLGPEDAADARAAAELRYAAQELRAGGCRARAARRRRRGAGGARRVEVRDDAARRRRAGRRRARRSARAASAPCSCAGSRTASSRCSPSPEPFLDDDARAELARASGLVLRPPRGRAGPRALPALRVRLAPGGGAVPLLPHLRRGGRPGAAVAVPRRRARAVHRRAVGAARHAAAGRGHVAARHGADAARAAAGARRRRARPGARAAGPARPARPCARRSRRAGRRRPAGWRRSRPAACAGSSRACSSRSAIEPDPEPMRRGSLAHAVLERTLRRLRERDGLGAPDPGLAGRRAGGAARRAARAARARGGRRPRRRRAARARGGPRELPPPRGRVRRRAGAAASWSGASAARATSTRRWPSTAAATPSRAASTGSTSTTTGPPSCATTRAASSPPAHAGPPTASCRRRCTRSPRTSCSGSRRPARCTSRSGAATGARAGSSAPARPGRYVNGDVVEPDALEAALGEARQVALDAARAMHAGRIAPCPSRCSPKGCAYPGICRAAEDPA